MKKLIRILKDLLLIATVYGCGIYYVFIILLELCK